MSRARVPNPMRSSSCRICVCLVVLLMMCVGMPPEVVVGSRVKNARRSAMPWMCLERCGMNYVNIQNNLFQLSKLAGEKTITMVAFERYNLGAGGTLVNNSGSLSVVSPDLISIGVETWPMISSFPYPPEFLSYMQTLFYDERARDAFFQQCRKEALTWNHSGYNVDWEPSVGNGAPQPTHEDARAYASFLSDFADHMRDIGVGVSVDVASWSAIWNWTEIGLANLHGVVLMDTYTPNWTAFQSHLRRAVDEIGVEKLVVGLSTAVTNRSAVARRFRLINSISGLNRVAVWNAPITPVFVDQLKGFVHEPPLK